MAASAAIMNSTKLSIFTFTVLLILLSTLLQPSSSSSSSSLSSSSYTAANKDPLSFATNRELLAMQRNTRQQQQIPNCSEMVSRSQCSQNPNCRWCKSDYLDDMCFSKTEAWRLPQQVFLCN